MSRSARSGGASTIVAPSSANGSALARVRLYTARSQPASSSRVASATPMRPQPTQPNFFSVSLPSAIGKAPSPSVSVERAPSRDRESPVRAHPCAIDCTLTHLRLCRQADSRDGRTHLGTKPASARNGPHAKVQMEWCRGGGAAAAAAMRPTMTRIGRPPSRLQTIVRSGATQNQLRAHLRGAREWDCIPTGRWPSTGRSASTLRSPARGAAGADQGGLLAESSLGALLCFDMSNIRYITATHIGTWAMDKLARFCLLPQNDEPIMWDFGSAARHHELYCPWLGDGPLAGRHLDAARRDVAASPAAPRTSPPRSAARARAARPARRAGRRRRGRAGGPVRAPARGHRGRRRPAADAAERA